MKTKPEPSEAQGRALSDPLPMPGSPEATAMMDSILAEYGHPANMKNAARAGFEAARRLLRVATPTDAARAQEQAPQDAGALREAARQLADTVRDLQIRSPYLEARMNDVYAALTQSAPQASPAQRLVVAAIGVDSVHMAPGLHASDFPIGTRLYAAPLQAKPEASGNAESAMETLIAVANHFGIDPDAEQARPGYDPKGPASKTIIAAIERTTTATPAAREAESGKLKLTNPMVLPDERKRMLALLEMVLDDMTICIDEGGRDYEFQELSEETVAALWEFSNDWRKD